MNKFSKIAAILAFVVLLPGLASAHNDGTKNDNYKGGIFHGIDIKHFFDFRGDMENKKSFSGTVTAVGSTSFDIKTKDNVTYTVNTAGAKITQAFGADIQLSAITLNSNVQVRGALNGNVVTASKVVVTPANTHKAVGVGTVTAVSGNTVTLQTNSGGIPNTVTVNTSASTTVMQNGSTTTLVSIQVGSKVAVKGLWDEIKSLLNAFKVHILK